MIRSMRAGSSMEPPEASANSNTSSIREPARPDGDPLDRDALKGEGGAEGEEEEGRVLGLDAHAHGVAARALDLDDDGVQDGPVGGADLLEGRRGELGDGSLRPGLGVRAAAFEDQDDALEPGGEGLGPIVAPELPPDPAREGVDYLPAFGLP